MRWLWPATKTRMKPTVRRLAVWRGSSAAGTLKARRSSAVRASMRRRRPAPAVVRQRCAVKSVRHETVLSLSTIGFARLRLPLAGDHRLERVDADALQPRRRDRGLVGRLAAGAQLAAVERVADLDALGLAVADLGRDEDRRELRRRAGRVGADADGADAAELEPAVLRVAGELLAARVGDEAAGHAAEVAEERRPSRARRGACRSGAGSPAWLGAGVGGRRRRGRRRRRRLGHRLHRGRGLGVGLGGADVVRRGDDDGDHVADVGARSACTSRPSRR